MRGFIYQVKGFVFIKKHFNSKWMAMSHPPHVNWVRSMTAAFYLQRVLSIWWSCFLFSRSVLRLHLDTTHDYRIVCTLTNDSIEPDPFWWQTSAAACEWRDRTAWCWRRSWGSAAPWWRPCGVCTCPWPCSCVDDDEADIYTLHVTVTCTPRHDWDFPARPCERRAPLLHSYPPSVH